MKITVIQQDIAWKDVATNIERLKRLVANAERSDLYLFPEMCSTGFCMQPEGVAEDAEGRTVQRMKQLAVEFDAALAVPVMTHIGGKYYNRMYFITPEGIKGTYDKCNLFEYSGEDKVFVPGKERVIWNWRGVRICPAICYDLRFPIWSRNHGDYDMILYVASWPTPRVAAWSALLVARAIENQCYVAGVNRVGTDPACQYCGGSVVIDPYGKTIASCADNQECEASAEIDIEVLEAFRQKFHVLNDADF